MHRVEGVADFDRDTLAQLQLVERNARQLALRLRDASLGAPAVEQRDCGDDGRVPDRARRGHGLQAETPHPPRRQEIDTRLAGRLRDPDQLRVDALLGIDRAELGSIGHCAREHILVRRGGLDGGTERAVDVDLLRLGQQEAQLRPREPHRVLRPNDRGARILDRHLRGQDVVIGRRARRLPPRRLIEMTRLLGQVLLGDARQLARRQHVPVGHRHVARHGLLEATQLLIAVVEPQFRGANGCADLPPGEHSL